MPLLIKESYQCLTVGDWYSWHVSLTYLHGNLLLLNQKEFDAHKNNIITYNNIAKLLVLVLEPHPNIPLGKKLFPRTTSNTGNKSSASLCDL